MERTRMERSTTTALCAFLFLGGVGSVAGGAPDPALPGLLDLPPENADPFWEPTESEFWGGGDGDAPAPLKPVRLTNTTTAVFEAYIRRGIPVIVTDAARGWSDGGMGDWTCESVRTMFKGQHAAGDAPIFLQYANADGQGGIKPVEMGSTAWQEHKHDNGEGDAPKGPKLAPIYWGVKDGENRGPGSLFDKVKRFTKLPYFLRRTQGNVDFVPSTPEFWFSRPGAGAKAHQDSHCQGTMSVQLSGVKRWRIGPSPPVPNLATARPLYDSYIDTARWRPLYDFELRKGEGLFFPTSFLHETFNVGDVCAASITFQYDFPQPTTFLRRFLPRLYSAPNMQECRLQGMYDRAILLGQQGTMRPTRAPATAADAAALRKAAARLVSRLDRDGSGALNLAEIAASAGRGQGADEMARDAVAFHDTDGDGAVSAAEVGESWVRWNAVSGAARAGRDAMRRYRRLRLRAGCGDDSATRAAERAVAALLGVRTGKRPAAPPTPEAIAMAIAAPEGRTPSPRCRAFVAKQYVALLADAHMELPNLEVLKVDPTKQSKQTGTDEDEFDEFVDDYDSVDGGGIGADGSGGGHGGGGHGGGGEDEDGEEDEEEEEERRDGDEDDNDRDEL